VNIARCRLLHRLAKVAVKINALRHGWQVAVLIVRQRRWRLLPTPRRIGIIFIRQRRGDFGCEFSQFLTELRSRRSALNRTALLESLYVLNVVLHLEKEHALLRFAKSNRNRRWLPGTKCPS